MIDIGSATLEKLVVHHVGNRVREEGYILSKNEANLNDELKDLLLRHYLAPFGDASDPCVFFHEVDLSMNPIYFSINEIFRNPSNFLKQSENIARHLYGVTLHPNIAGGELIISLYANLDVGEGVPSYGIGILRIEDRDYYLDVTNEEDTFQLMSKTGISLSRIQKGVLILENDRRAFVIDTQSKKSRYWMDAFLKVTPGRTPKTFARVGAALLKGIASQVREPESHAAISRSIGDLLDENEEVTIGQIRNLSSNYVSDDVMTGILTGIQDRAGFDLDDSLEINAKALAQQSREIMTKTPIHEGVSLVITNKKVKLRSLELEEKSHGFRAIADLTFVQGEGDE